MTPKKVSYTSLYNPSLFTVCKAIPVTLLIGCGADICKELANQKLSSAPPPTPQVAYL